MTDTKQKRRKKQPHWTELLTRKDIVIHCEWTRAQVEACLEQFYKEIFKLRERVDELERRR